MSAREIPIASSSSPLADRRARGHPVRVTSVGLETRVLAMSLDLARSGIESARLQQQLPQSVDGAQAQPTDVILELSAAAQALMQR